MSLHCKIISKSLCASLILLIALSMSGCAPMQLFAPKPYKETQFVMDTIIEITAYGPNKEAAAKKAFDEFKRIQLISDHYDPQSQVSEINKMAGIGPVRVDKDLITMIHAAKDISQKTDGAFDISVGPLTELWGIGHKGDFVPTREEIQKVLPLIDYRRIEVDSENSTVYLPQKGMELDLGGMAKDYALNKAVEVLKEQGIKSALVNAGGDIQVIGTKPDGQPWRIGVQNPRDSEGIAAKVTLSAWDTSQTSGDYQRYFIKDGVRYAHILNPRTGDQPTELASVTLIYTAAGQNGIASSGLMVLGLERSLEVLKNYPGVEAIFVTTDGKVVVTPGLKDKAEL